MDTFLKIVDFIAANYQAMITGLVATLSGLIAIFLIVPGDQPEKFLKSVVDFLSKFSKK